MAWWLDQVEARATIDPMKVKSVYFHLLTMFWLTFARCILAQAPVVGIHQVIPFAMTGTVTSGALQPQIVEKPISKSPGSTSETPAPESAPVPKPLLPMTAAGGQITTGVESATSLVLANAGAARMGADSEVRVPSQGEKSHSLEMLKGQLFLNVRGDELKRRKQEFKLKTPAALLAVKGTKFFTSTANGVDTIGVHEGSVSVAEPRSGKSVTVEAGFAVSVSVEAVSEIRPLNEMEMQQAGEYEKAKVKKVPITTAFQDEFHMNGGTYPGKFFVFKDGKPQVRFDQDDENVTSGLYRGLESCVIAERNHYQARETSMTPEGYLRHSWIPGATGGGGNVWLKLRGKGLDNELEPGDKSQLMPVLGIRFRIRTINVKAVAIATNGLVAAVPGLDGAIYDKEWMEVLLPVIPSVPSPKRRAIPGFSIPNLIFTPVRKMDKRFPTATQTAVDLTDFELILAE